MKARSRLLWPASVILCLVLMSSLAFAQGKARQLMPNRLSSTGDSITEAIDAELPLPITGPAGSMGTTDSGNGYSD